MQPVDTKMYNTRELPVAKQHPRSDKMYNVQVIYSLRIDDDLDRDRGFVIFVCRTALLLFSSLCENSINIARG